MALSSQQKQAVSQIWAQQAFVAQNIMANFNMADLQAAVTAIDNALDATLTQAVAAVGGGTTVINGMSQVIPAPFSGATAAQKTVLVCYTLMKRAGII